MPRGLTPPGCLQILDCTDLARPLASRSWSDTPSDIEPPLVDRGRGSLDLHVKPDRLTLSVSLSPATMEQPVRAALGRRMSCACTRPAPLPARGDTGGCSSFKKFVGFNSDTSRRPASPQFLHLLPAILISYPLQTQLANEN